MKISKAEDQAVRLAARLARADRQLTLAELAALERLPEPTVAKLLGKLRRGGVVEAVRGRHGGYVLARPAERIAVLEILSCLEDRLLRGSGCSRARPSDERCPHLADCGLRPVWQHLERMLSRLLAATSLADLQRSEREIHLELVGREGESLRSLIPNPRGASES